LTVSSDYPADVLFVYAIRADNDTVVDDESPLIQEEVTIAVLDIARVGRRGGE